jgi:DNA modification methylase
MNQVFFGDCRETMRRLIADGVKVQTCVTSPPYWGLWDYGASGQLGLERTPQEYVERMAEVFGLVRDLLADDGTLWLNLGDSYAANHGSGFVSPGDKQATNQGSLIDDIRRPRNAGLKPKDLVGIPWRVAFALQAAGWYLRCDIIWHKPNPMPESVTDRPTKSHEYIFLMSKNERYYYDAEAIKEDGVTPVDSKAGHTFGGVKNDTAYKAKSNMPGKKWEWEEKRNKRTVWTVTTVPFSGAHFATFPPALIEPCILAGSRPGDIVLDPFFGSGTTGQVAEQLGRQWIGCELQRGYEPLQKKRTAQKGLVF